MPTLTNQQRQLVTAMADCDMRPSNAARQLGWDRKTVYNHMNIIREQTGLDPYRFRDLCRLMEGPHA